MFVRKPFIEFPMRMKPCAKYLLLLCVVSLFLGACSVNECEEETKSGLQGDSQMDRTKVLSDLRVLVQSIDSVQSLRWGRSKSQRIERRSFSDADVVLLGNSRKVYLVNFDRQMGYAILAADKRVTKPLIVLTDRGSLAHSALDSVLSGMPGTSTRFNPERMTLELVQAYLEEACVSGYDPAVTSYPLENEWMITAEIKPMIQTLWGQSEPFNDLSPIKRKSLWSASRKCPVGCVPLALSQLITYHAYPKDFVCQGQSVDYALLGSVFAADADGDISFGPYVQAVNQMAASLCREVGNLCGAMYRPDWTLVLPAGAASCLRKLQYPSVTLHKGYQEKRMLEMLAEGNPVPVFAMDHSFHGHAWLIDGMIKRQKRSETSAQQLLLHCNFGWWGRASGYYASGIFDTRRGAELRQNYEARFGANASYTFLWSFYQISYAKPQ